MAFGKGYHSDYVPPTLTDDHAACLERYLAGEEVGLDALRACCAVDPVKPWHILAITFTNKAAAGSSRAGSPPPSGRESQDIMAATFHSFCARVLRRGDRGPRL